MPALLPSKASVAVQGETAWGGRLGSAKGGQQEEEEMRKRRDHKVRRWVRRSRGRAPGEAEPGHGAPAALEKAEGPEASEPSCKGHLPPRRSRSSRGACLECGVMIHFFCSV